MKINYDDVMVGDKIEIGKVTFIQDLRYGMTKVIGKEDEERALLLEFADGEQYRIQIEEHDIPNDIVLQYQPISEAVDGLEMV